MEREIMLAMRLVGATRVEELVPEMVRSRYFVRDFVYNIDNIFQVEQVSWQPVLAKL